VGTTPSFLDTKSQVLIDCRVQLPDFEGPLDLLLHLIKSHELDILNLPIAKITKQYLAYLDYMRELNLDLASEYLLMAATLTYLKSQVILPQEETTEGTGHDPRAQLIRRLVELKNYKELSRLLEERPRLFREVYPCRNNGAEEILDTIDPEVALTNPFQMIVAYRDLMSRRKEVVHNVVYDDVPVSTCMQLISEALENGEGVTFQSLLPQVCKPTHIISTFLGVLEMTKLQMTTIIQNGTFEPIKIHRKASLDELKTFRNGINAMSWD
jgi:segregation and condensation protein A